MTSGTIALRPLCSHDNHAFKRWMRDHWGAEIVVGHGEVMAPSRLPGFVAQRGGRWIGAITYRITGASCEIVTVDSDDPGRGIGTALIEAVRRKARCASCSRLWLITTNDNLHALGFYQRRGFTLAALHRNAVERSRVLKPEIPLIGNDGIPLRDEIELEMSLDPADGGR